jgi:hypothetical protein
MAMHQMQMGHPGFVSLQQAAQMGFHPMMHMDQLEMQVEPQ